MEAVNKLNKNVEAVSEDLLQKNWIGTSAKRMLERRLNGMIELRKNLMHTVQLCDDVIKGLEKMMAIKKQMDESEK